MTFLTRALTSLTATALAGAVVLASGGVAHAANALGGSTLTGSGSGRCAPMTTRSITGTLLGRDGLALNATIGFDFKDASGRAIDARTGCAASGYGAILQLNHYIGADGAAVGSEMTSAQGADEGAVDPHFAVLDLPANVKTVYVETYTRRYTGSPCGLPCAGTTDASKYGFVNRQGLSVGNGLNLNLVADETPAFGGDTGAIQLYIHDTSVGSVHAWSMSINGKKSDEGWGVGVQSRVNRHLWTIAALSPGQQYTLIIGGHGQSYHIKVNAKKTTRVNEKF